MKVLRYIFYFLLLFIAIVVLSSYFDKPPVHTFWQEQPVTWDISGVPDLSSCTELVVIGPLPDYDLRIPQFAEFSVLDASVDNMDAVGDFLHMNFSSYLRISRAAIKSHLSREGSSNIGYYYKNELVGFIHGRPIRIVYKDIEYPVHYVEYLCVKREERGNNISPLLISRYIQEAVRKEGRTDIWFIFKKDGRSHPFQSFVESEYRGVNLMDISTSMQTPLMEGTSIVNINPVDDETIKTDIYNRWVLYSTQFTFHHSLVESELLSPQSQLWICGIDRVALITKDSELYEPTKGTYTPVMDIEYIAEWTEDTYNESHPWTLVELFTCWKRNKYGYITINHIGRNIEIMERLDTDKIYKWESANPFQYYAFNFKCPRIPKEEFYLTIN